MTSGELRGFPFGKARVATLAEVRTLRDWPAAFQGQIKDHRFYELIQETLDCGFEHHYFVFQDHTGAVRAVQPFFFAQQNLLEGVPALHRAVDLIRRRFPRFCTMRLLMVGCVIGAGRLGLCRAGDGEWVTRALFVALDLYAKSSGAQLVVLKDFPPAQRPTLERFAENGYTRLPSMPLTELPLAYRDFEEYFATLGKATRKNLRRKFRRVERAAPIQFEVLSDISPWVDEIYPLYLAVRERSALKFETLTKEYFREISRRLPERARFFLWRQEGRIIAFDLCLVHNGEILDECLGLDYRVAHELHLYFFTFRDIIRWALAQGLVTYRSSPLHYEPKLALDCSLVPLDLYVRHTSPWLNRIIPPFLTWLGPTRHDPTLHRFPNAQEL